MLPARLIALCLLALAAGALSGCATPPTSTPGPRAESSIPWNRPAKWEGPGVLGGGMPGAQ